MIQGNINNSPVRQVKGKVELYEGSTLLNTFTYRDRLISFTVERVGEESKFFGFGICQKLNVKLIDKDRELSISTANSFKVYLTTDDTYYTPFPTFYVSEVHRDENTNELSITAYDTLYKANSEPYVIRNDLTKPIHYARRCSDLLDLPTERVPLEVDGEVMGYVDDIIIETPNIPTTDNFYTLSYEDGINAEGSEKIRDILDDLAEASQSVYYLDNKDHLVFKRLDRDGAAALIIGKSDYIDLDSKTNRRLSVICHATELGDNVEATLDVSGSTQFVRDNALWSLREDIGAIVEAALAAIGGITINQFDCSWRGNYLLEPGDKIDLITKDNATVSAYLLNDSIEYDGSLNQKTSWKYEDKENETAANPTSLGEALNQTFARVDKANKKIEMVVSDVKTNSENISSLEATAEDISLKVGSVEEATNDAIEGINENIERIENDVALKLTDSEVSIKINEALANGVGRVETSTGFIFDETGLTISKTGNELSTTITEDGMTIKRNEDTVLTVNNMGVDARNLHATTYLLIGNNSRFQDYGDNNNRTGCFWIGGYT